MARRDLIIQNRTKILALADKHGARAVRLFGSVARGDEQPQSDIDLLVRFDADRSLFDHGAMIADLEELLKTRVDVVNESGVSERFRRVILDEAVPL